MAEYAPALKQQDLQYNSVLDLPAFKDYYSQKPTQESSSQDPLLSKSTQQAAAYGGQSGGLSGALTNGGVSSLLTAGASTGNLAAIGGGLILSQIEAAQKAKAAAEQERIQNQKDTMAKTQVAYQNMANQRFNV